MFGLGAAIADRAKQMKNSGTGNLENLISNRPQKKELEEKNILKRK